MKYLCFLTFAAMVVSVSSCKKSTGKSTPPNGGGKLTRIQQGVDPDITNDTVYRIVYNAAGQIASIVDSLNQDTLTASYDATNNLTGWRETYGTSTDFTYNGSQLTQIDQELAGSHEQFVFSYTSNTLSRVDYNSDLGSGGGVAPQGYSIITMLNGNIGEVQVYSNGGTLLQATTFTYGSETNYFQKISLFDVGGILGTDDIFNQLTWFNQNLLTGSSSGGQQLTSTYSFNNADLPVRVVTNDPNAGGIYTWQFSY
jgi:hypothetical protein